jgi:hypothetical protein
MRLVDPFILVHEATKAIAPGQARRHHAPTPRLRRPLVRMLWFPTSSSATHSRRASARTRRSAVIASGLRHRLTGRRAVKTSGKPNLLPICLPRRCEV